MMIIENNAKELAAMQEFHNGNRQEGLRLQEEFAAQFRAEYADKDHCPCRKACRYHGNCKECVAIHRAHQEHVPNCMRPMLNKKIKALQDLQAATPFIHIFYEFIVIRNSSLLRVFIILS